MGRLPAQNVVCILALGRGPKGDVSAFGHHAGRKLLPGLDPGRVGIGQDHQLTVLLGQLQLC
jgi:hypothetical protein